MSLLKKLWITVRRNPVINAFLAAVAIQIAHDALANQIDWTNILGYLATVLLGVMARALVTPNAKHEETKELVSKVIVRLEADHQKRLNEMLDRFEGKRGSID
jgi:hypothetical protein